MQLLESRLMSIYEKDGLQKVIQVANALLKVDPRGDNDRKGKSNGNVCEILLRIMSIDYLRRHNIPYYETRSLVLRNPSISHSFFTELDYTIFTPNVILCGECKSYSSTKVITEECTIATKHVTTDVYAQQLLHLNALKEHTKNFLLTDKDRFRIFCFIHSIGNIQDNRELKWRRICPVITSDNLYSFYNDTFEASTKQVYDYKRLFRLIEIISNNDSLHRKHKEYLGY